ncbi:MAG: hypothetical protein ABSA58_06500 [Acetobacteraceae bacterium]
MPFQNEPHPLELCPGRGNTRELELHDDTIGRQFIGFYPDPHGPQKQTRIQIVRGDPAAGILHAPIAEGRNQSAKRFASRGQMILTAPPGTRPDALYQTVSFQLAQTLSQQGPRHQWHALVNFVERMGARHQLPEHERCPSRGEDLGGLGDRTKLAISVFHTAIPSWRAFSQGVSDVKGLS